MRYEDESRLDMEVGGSQNQLDHPRKTQPHAQKATILETPRRQSVQAAARLSACHQPVLDAVDFVWWAPRAVSPSKARFARGDGRNLLSTEA